MEDFDNHPVTTTFELETGQSVEMNCFPDGDVKIEMSVDGQKVAWISAERVQANQEDALVIGVINNLTKETAEDSLVNLLRGRNRRRGGKKERTPPVPSLPSNQTKADSPDDAQEVEGEEVNKHQEHQKGLVGRTLTELLERRDFKAIFIGPDREPDTDQMVENMVKHDQRIKAEYIQSSDGFSDVMIYLLNHNQDSLVTLYKKAKKSALMHSWSDV